MPEGFKLDFEIRPGYLLARASGPDDNREISRLMWEGIAAEVRRLDARRLLVEESFPNQVGTDDMYEVGELIARLFPAGMRIAHVDLCAADMALNAFGATVVNAGGVQAGVFHNRGEAVAWLDES